MCYVSWFPLGCLASGGPRAFAGDSSGLWMWKASGLGIFSHGFIFMFYVMVVFKQVYWTCMVWMSVGAVWCQLKSRFISSLIRCGCWVGRRPPSKAPRNAWRCWKNGTERPHWALGRVIGWLWIVFKFASMYENLGVWQVNEVIHSNLVPSTKEWAKNTLMQRAMQGCPCACEWSSLLRSPSVSLGVGFVSLLQHSSSGPGPPIGF